MLKFNTNLTQNSEKNLFVVVLVVVFVFVVVVVVMGSGASKVEIGLYRFLPGAKIEAKDEDLERLDFGDVIPTATGDYEFVF